MGRCGDLGLGICQAPDIPVRVETRRTLETRIAGEGSCRCIKGMLLFATPQDPSGVVLVQFVTRCQPPGCGALEGGVS